MTAANCELYRLFERSPIGMYRCDLEGNLHHVNAALVRLLGYDSAEELLAKNLNRDIYVDPEDRVRLIERFRPMGAIPSARVRWKTKRGQELTVQLCGHVVEDAASEVFDVSVLDVTEIEAANAQLRKQREVLATTAAMLDLVVRQMTAIYWIVDRELRICTAGGAIQELLGFAPGRFVGMTIEQVHRIDPGSIDTIAMHRRALAGETITFASEYRNKHLV
ncbi:MAG TPA: PAS domain S-box protein, partial [Kofleriaceae bacterium]|nr:PAS domain S-box protein [Kofleriaceae bacterium]